MLYDFTQNIIHYGSQFGTPGQLADLLGVKQYKVIGWSMGWISPSPDELLQLSKLLGVSINDLANEPVEKKYSQWQALQFSPFTKN